MRWHASRYLLLSTLIGVLIGACNSKRPNQSVLTQTKLDVPSNRVHDPNGLLRSDWRLARLPLREQIEQFRKSSSLFVLDTIKGEATSLNVVAVDSRACGDFLMGVVTIEPVKIESLRLMQDTSDVYQFFLFVVEKEVLTWGRAGVYIEKVGHRSIGIDCFDGIGPMVQIDGGLSDSTFRVLQIYTLYEGMISAPFILVGGKKVSEERVRASFVKGESPTDWDLLLNVELTDRRGEGNRRFEWTYTSRIVHDRGENEPGMQYVRDESGDITGRIIDISKAVRAMRKMQEGE